MKILVAVKRVVDHNVKVRVNENDQAVDTTNTKKAINPFCEIAVEEAVRLKENNIANEVVVVSVGSAAVQEQLRTALALGADRGIRVETEQVLEPLAVAKCLKAVVDKEAPDLIFLGKQSIDGDNNQTGQMLAALCNMPQGTFASKVEVAEGTVAVTREIDGGLQTLKLRMPAVITTDLRLNEPRYASLPNIMKAKRKPLQTYSLDALGVQALSQVKLVSVAPPTQRKPGVKAHSVAELIDKLKHEAGVL
ncbi:electron transfer flavoprotein subunit beta/FixA family protein [Alteromonas sp. C1M14]|uniref:electron transfer flavoprotein subunit beta/FixA family protein n=1 Tax=Alteromonas sp. C1M14 TaxID=2841567 RepID=UPI001C09BC96|nr:electron transfer flavoprotein subunit beta/FixA family protein [Alteromonas sp. C1M14]MBU2980017.1 electron transfer flavoprotein subunit beta/FixA family protein [Alteromonas sp. C1M14]